MLRATTPCTFSSSQLPKLLRTPQFLTHVTSTCASRHNAVHFFNISISKSGPNPSVFNTFYLHKTIDRIYIYKYVYVYVYIYLHIYIYTYIYIYLYTFLFMYLFYLLILILPQVTINEDASYGAGSSTYLGPAMMCNFVF